MPGHSICILEELPILTNSLASNFPIISLSSVNSLRYNSPTTFIFFLLVFVWHPQSGLLRCDHCTSATSCHWYFGVPGGGEKISQGRISREDCWFGWQQKTPTAAGKLVQSLVKETWSEHQGLCARAFLLHLVPHQDLYTEFKFGNLSREIRVLILSIYQSSAILTSNA
jgi:hypothetical protein